MQVENLQDILRPYIEQYASTYRKRTMVTAKLASGGECVATVVEGHVETMNVANKGDYIVTNNTGDRESYILSDTEFNRRYKKIYAIEVDRGIYQIKTTALALEFTAKIIEETNLQSKLYFLAPWGAYQYLEEGDFLLSNHSYENVYRISRAKFFETYEPVLT